LAIASSRIVRLQCKATQQEMVQLHDSTRDRMDRYRQGASTEPAADADRCLEPKSPLLWMDVKYTDDGVWVASVDGLPMPARGVDESRCEAMEKAITAVLDQLRPRRLQ